MTLGVFIGAIATVALAGLLALGVLALAGIHPRIEESASMSPTLKPGDLLLVKTVPASSARSGDIVTFPAPGRSLELTHRVIRVKAAHGRLFFVTRGDANTGVERWDVPSNGTIGHEVVAVPYLGRLLQDVRGAPLVIAIWLATPFLLLGLVGRIWRPREPSK